MNRHDNRANGRVVIKDTMMTMLVICIRTALYGGNPNRWPRP